MKDDISYRLHQLLEVKWLHSVDPIIQQLPLDTKRHQMHPDMGVFFVKRDLEHFIREIKREVIPICTRGSDHAGNKSIFILIRVADRQNNKRVRLEGRIMCGSI